MTLMALLWFQAEVLGYSRLYLGSSKVFSFLVFTEHSIYWPYRTLHHPRLYKTFHRPHHKWITYIWQRILRFRRLIYLPSPDPLRALCIPIHITRLSSLSLSIDGYTSPFLSL
ncbi:hypothetical protein PAXRUDRAFT_565333 [Paxillus rubicundulus Ve08.2h10]|uniref:Fatty acid hydroxylase domain-containing protein n=1 Tax=Paxillus rubicundulus Ve08.2h10 TaxID=930991 RepID=A0A0D0DM42_9AGAM|nr:hypothetical protein PAXRUDRAFT_565333 [Paxillus rubicundulus Ve08.2h10]